MKKTFLPLCMLIMLVSALFSCSGTNEAGTKVFEYVDTADHVLVQLSVELPQGTDSVSAEIRGGILDDLHTRVKYTIAQGDERTLDIYEGDTRDGQAMVDFYGKILKEELTSMRNDVINDIQSADADSADVEEECEASLEDTFPPYSCEINITHLQDSIFGEPKAYDLYQSEVYTYFAGAHGSYDVNYLTFNTANGHIFTRFIPESALKDMQPLLKEGLVEYFSNDAEQADEETLSEWLLDEYDPIPMPVTPPCPTAEGLFFTYGQYEIAPYAAGTPSFTIPYSKIVKCLTPEAKKLLGL